MRGVAAAQRLRRIERRVVAQGDERVLQRRARARVRVDVARRHRRHPEPLGQPGQPAVARAVVALERPLQLDAQVLAPEGGQQPPQRRLVVHAVARAAAQADEPGGVLLERLQRHGRRRLAVIARVGVRAREDVAEVAPALLRVDQQREVAAVVEVDLRPVDRLQPEPLGGLRELHRAAQPVVVGQREGAVAQLGRGGRQLLGQRGAVEEGEGGVGVQLGVHGCEHMFACRRRTASTGSARPAGHARREPMAAPTPPGDPPRPRAVRLGARARLARHARDPRARGGRRTASTGATAMARGRARRGRRSQLTGPADPAIVARVFDTDHDPRGARAATRCSRARPGSACRALERLGARRARGARAAGQRRRRAADRGEAGRASSATAGRFPAPEAVADGPLPGMPRPRERALRALAARGRRRPAARPAARRRGDARGAARAAGLRALDRRVHRHARAARSRRLAGAATSGSPRAAGAADAERWRPWRAYAAMVLWQTA